MPPNATRAAVIVPSAMVSLNAPHTAEMSLSNRRESFEMCTRSSGTGRGTWIALDEFARLAVLLAVIEEEVLQRHRPPSRQAAQGQRRAERDQRGRAIADRRAVGDVAADGARVAHLQPGEAADQLAQFRTQPRERGVRLGIAHRTAQRDAFGILGDVPELGDVADEHRRCQSYAMPW